jgi:hypothetical protein
VSSPSSSSAACKPVNRLDLAYGVPTDVQTIYSCGICNRSACVLQLYCCTAVLLAGTFRVPADIQYEDFVRVSKEILRGRATQEQHALVRRVLLSLVPPGVPAACK